MKKFVVSSNVLQIRSLEKTPSSGTSRPDTPDKKCIVELTERTKKLVEAAKLNPDILVYR